MSETISSDEESGQRSAEWSHPRSTPHARKRLGNLRVGVACLAWPGSALGQGPLRSALPVAASVILPSVAPLLAGFETDTEAKGVAVAVAGRVFATLGGAQGRPGVVPRATACHAIDRKSV
ncbi:MAG: hypothetical protein VB980_06705, partial [Opitutales bacterium]